MSAITHKANLVAELQNRLSEGDYLDEDMAFLVAQLEDQAESLEGAMIFILRSAREDEAYDDALGVLISDMQERRKRIRGRAEKKRADVAWAMQEAGMPKLVAPDMTVSFRIGKAPLIIDGEPGEGEVLMGWATVKHVFSWDKDRLRKDLSEEADIPFARFGNPQPVLTIRGK